MLAHANTPMTLQSGFMWNTFDIYASKHIWKLIIFSTASPERARVHEVVCLLTWQPPWGQRIHLLNGKHCGCNIWTWHHVMHLWYVNSSCIAACLLAEDWRGRGKSSCKFYIYWFCRTAWKQSPVVQESWEWELSYWRAIFDHMSDKLSTFTNQSLIWSFTTKILSFDVIAALT